MKILLVDDSRSDQFYNLHIIKNNFEGATIRQAMNGKEALDIIEKEDFEPNIILLDINMPIMGGFQFLDEYTKIGGVNSLVIMLSSSGQEQDKEKANEYSCVKDFLTKPLNADSLAYIKKLMLD